MSKWYLVKKDDIDLDVENGEEVLNIYLDSDDNGNIYAEIKVKDIIEKLNLCNQSQQNIEN